MAPGVTSKRAPAKRAAVKATAVKKAAPAKKTAAKTAVKKSTPAKAAVKYRAGTRLKAPEVATGPKVPVFVDGQPAMNRHYLISLDVAEGAAAKAAGEGWPLAEVLRLGFDQYVKGVRRRPKPEKEPLVALPKDALAVLATAWATGDRGVQNRTVAAFHHAGWPLRTLADALVAAGAVKSMTRQAVSLRVLAAEGDLSKVKGVVTPSGPRRTLTATASKPHVELKDVGVRVADDVYNRVKIRARGEGAQMSALVEDILVRYLGGSFKMPKRKLVVAGR